MPLRMNGPMRDLLGPEFAGPDAVEVSAPAGMLESCAVEEGYKEFDGCIVPASHHASKPLWPRSGQRDETGFECLLSQVHVDDFVDPKTTPLRQMVLYGLAYALCLRNALLASGVRGPFRIIVSGQFASEEYNANSCLVRFHRRRDGQRWLLDNLEEYTQPVLGWDFDRPG